jgi:hypothetical protein
MVEVNWNFKKQPVAPNSALRLAGKNPPAPVPTYDTVEIPEIDPASGAAIGTTQQVQAKRPLKYENYPTLAEKKWPGLMSKNVPPNYTLKNVLSLQYGLNLTSNAQEVKDVLSSNYPGVTYTNDMYGNPLAVIDGKKYHIDRPDLNRFDANRFAAKTAVAAPFVVGAAALLPESSAGLMLSVLGQTVAGAAGEYATEKGAQAAGSKQAISPASIVEAGGMGALGPLAARGVGSLYRIMSPDIFSKLPRGTQNFLMKYADQFKLSGINPDTMSGADYLLDDQRLKSLSSGLMRQDKSAADVIENALTLRENGKISRVQDAIDRNLGKQTTDEREFDALLKSNKSLLSDQLDPILKNATPINPEKVAAIVSKIDDELKTAKGPVASALRKARSYLVLEEGQPVSLLAVNDVNAADVFKNFDLGTQPQIAAKTAGPVYETSAGGLENARHAMDTMINFGDETVGIKPKTLVGSRAVGSVQKDVSNLLKSDVDGYAGIMEGKSDIYGLIDANEAGANIFNRGPNGLRPYEIAAFTSDPDKSKAFYNGVRSAFDNKLRSSPNDVLALRKSVGGEGDFLRQNLVQLYGQDAVEDLLNIAEREQGYNETAQKLRAAREEGISELGSETLGEAENPSKEIPKEIAHLGTSAINVPIKAVRGQLGEGYKIGLADYLTGGPQEASAFQQGMNKAYDLRDITTPIQAAVAPTAQTAFTTEYPPEPNRMNRKSGGAVIDKAADALVSETMRNQKLLANHTEQMLSMPDDAIVQALNVARSVAA